MPKEILESHLNLRKEGRVDEDCALNYSEGCVFLTSFGEFHGHDGLRFLVSMLDKEIPGIKFTYKNILINRKLGFLEWTGESNELYIEDGADSYLIENGKITEQTIHYTIKKFPKF